MFRVTNIFQKSFYLFIFLLCLSGCNEEGNDCAEKAAESITLQFDRIDEQLMSSKTKEEVRNLLLNNPVYTNAFLDANQYPDLDIVVNKLYGMSKDPSIDTLYTEIRNVYGDLGELNSELTDGYSWLKHYFGPESKIPVIKTAISGLYNDLYVSDSVVVIGLDYFLGKEASFRPLNTPEYLLKRYEKESIAPLVFSVVSNKYLEIDKKDNTLLADMINYGRSYYFVEKMLPCKPDGWIIGYDDGEMSKIYANQEAIWAHFIDRELFFETNHFVKTKYTGERPNIFEIGDQCPGRIARWLGWEIVRAYMDKNPDITLSQLMQETDVQKILNNSKFKARNKQ